MKKKIAGMADLHFKGQRLEQRAGILRWCVSKALEEQCETIILAGDVIDSDAVGDRFATPGRIVPVINDCFQDARYCHVLAIEGNHDRKAAGRGSALMLFNGIESIRPVVAPSLRSGCYNFGPVNFIFQPWRYLADEVEGPFTPANYQDKRAEFNRIVQDRLRQLLAMAKPEYPTILVAHCRVVGALQNEGRTHKGGDPDDFDLPRDLLNEFDYLMLGDFHRRQEVIAGKGGYIGAMEREGFDEEDNPAGIEILAIEGKTISSQWFECPLSTQFRTVDVTELGDLEGVDGRIEEGQRWRFRYDYDDSEAAKLISARLNELARLFPGQIHPARNTILNRERRTEEQFERVDDPAAALRFYARSTSMNQSDQDALLTELENLYRDPA